MSSLSFKIETPDLKDFQRRQIPFVLARMNSRLAADITFKVREEVPSRFRGRTRFVQSGMIYERGTKADPTARVVNRDAHMWTHEGGQNLSRSAKGGGLLVPSEHYKKYGKRERPSELLKSREFFRNKDGIFKRRGRDHTTAYYWSADKFYYDNRLKVHETAQEYVNECAQRYFDNYLHEAVFGKK